MLGTSPPALEMTQVHSCLWGRYGLRGTLRPLPGERDQNFQVVTDRGRFVLKFHHPEEGAEVVDAQNGALECLYRVDPDLTVPRLIPPVDPTVSLEGRIIRLLSWVDGRPLGESMPLTTELREHLGRTLARLDRALVGFEHPGSEQDLLWDIQRASKLRPLLSFVAEEGVRRRAEETLGHFEEEVVPLLGGLPKQVIHNDANPGNVVTEGGRVSGLLDFGDMVRAPRIQELAVAASYHLAEPLLPALLPFCSGYHALLPLHRQEIELLPTLIAIRCVASITIGCWRHQILGAPQKNYATAVQNLRLLSHPLQTGIALGRALELS